MLEYYYTIKKSGIHEISIQKSRFISHVSRVKSAEDAQTFIQRIKKEHYSATHNCSAYITGEHDNIQKANDDGEPGGTAGMPMLDVLKKLELKNTVVVVTRYFGGIKLGAGGLIRAYSSATSEAVQKIGIVKGTLMQGFSISIPYPLLGKLQHQLENSSYIIEHINYTEHVELFVYVPSGEEAIFKDLMVNLTSDQADVKEIDKRYIERDVTTS